MELTKSNINLIFGLKLKQLRQSKNLSLSELANMSSLSVSYLNEIESGKKYPKSDKILALAEALGVSYDRIVSLKLNKSLAPIGELLDSNILTQLPVDHYGIDINKLIALLANAPIQLSALVSTIIEIAKSSEMSRNIFSKTALRIYKEFSENYFPDIEEKVEYFRNENNINELGCRKSKYLSDILVNKYNYAIDNNKLNTFDELSNVRAIIKKGNPNKIFLNKSLSKAQLSFILGKELAYNYLNITDRSYLYSASNLESFDQLLNNFITSYFATALFIPKDIIISDFELFLKTPKWDKKYLLNLLDKYCITPEMLFQRISNIAAKYFQINKFYFLRFIYDIESNQFELSKELRLNTSQNPGGNQLNEHYCRRWISIEVINELKNKIKAKGKSETKVIGIQKSKFINSGNEYLSISIAKPSRIGKNAISSVTFGFLVDSDLKNKMKFLNDPKIKTKLVNDTCENCTIQDCKERVADPTTAIKNQEKKQVQIAIENLFSQE